MLGRILVFLGGLLVVALFAALLVPYFIDWTGFRREFEDQASRILGKKVVVHGAVEARLLPFPSVTLHDVRAGQDADGSPLIQVARFSMDAELAPFLSGEARIFDMRIEEPKARIRLLKDGTLDWVRGSRAQIPARTVVLENVHLQGGQIEFIDEQSGRNRTVSGLDADMSASSLAGPWRADGRAAIDGHSGSFSLTSNEPDAVTGRVGLRVRLLPDEHPLEIALDGGLAAVEGRPVYSGSFSFLFRQDDKNKTKEDPDSIFTAPRTRGSFELTNERVRIPNYRMELGSTDNPYVVTGEATLDTGTAPEFLLIADGQQIDVDRFAPAVQKGKTARVPAISVRQRIETFAAMVAKIPVPQVPGKASIRLPALVADDTTIRDIRLEVQPAGAGWRVVNAVALLPGRTQLEANGSLTLSGGPAFSGDLLVASNQPSGLANWLSGSVDPAIRQLNTVGFSASVALTTQVQRFERLELAIGDASLKGRIERQSIDGQNANLSIDLSGNEINIDALRALGGLALGDQVGGSVLDHRIAAKLKADRFLVSDVAANNVETVFTLAGGILSLDKLTAGDVAGAQISASGKLEGSLLDYSGKGTVNFRAADPQPFLAMLQQRLPRHPLFDRMVDSGPWYANTDVTGEVSVGSGDGGVNLALSGTVNGSRLSAVAKLPDLLEITDDTALSFEAVLKNQSTAILFGQAGLDPLPFEADGEGLLSVKASGTLGNPAQTEMRFSTERTHFALNGAFALSAAKFPEGSADVSLESADIEPYMMMNGSALPQLGGGLAVKVKSRMEVQPAAVKLSGLAGQAGGNPFSGNLTIARADAHKVTGDFSIGDLDLAWLGEAMYGPVIDPATGKLNSQPVSLPTFPELEASIALKAANFHTDVFAPVTGFSAKLEHAAGGMALEEMSGDWLGGKISGRMSMATGEGAGVFRTKLAMSGLNPEPLLWMTAGKPVAAARLAVELTAEATGKSVHDMLDSAGGSGEIRAGGLVLRGINPAAFQPLLQGADALKGEINAALVQPMVNGLAWSGEVPLADLSVPFTISDGMMRMQNVAASTDQLRLSGAANIRLAEQTVTGGINIGFNAGNEALAGADPSVRLVYSGPLAAPNVETDVAGITGFLSLRAFERERRRVEALQASVLEKQRLRREAALYSFKASERQVAKDKAEAEERARLAEEARLKAAAEAEKLKAEAAAKAAEEERRKTPPTPSLTIPPTEEVIRQYSPPPAGTATP